jgi:hypothetical protein
LGTKGNANKKLTIGFPTPLRFSGMATARYWEFEDGMVNLNRVSTAPEDILQMIMLEFMLIYGNDFFTIPIDMKVGSLCQIKSLKVLDTFGVKTNIPPAFYGGLDNWSIYSLEYDPASHLKGSAPLFFLAPATGPVLESQLTEQVRFLRDEMSNLVWAVEHRVMGQSGLPIDRFEINQIKKEEKRKQEESERDTQEVLKYHLSSTEKVPDFWFPFVPIPDGETSYTLKKGRLLHNLEVQAADRAPQPWGTILGNLSMNIPEEEIPREGIEIDCLYHLARSTNGYPVLWAGRKRKIGRGEGSSGLRYDFLEFGKNQPAS